MPSRVIREGFLDSEKINSLSPEAERFFVRLMLVADDFGRFDARPKVLLSRCFPIGSETEKKILSWIDECNMAKLIRLYTINDKNYILINNFNQRLRAEKSKFPQPPTVDSQVTDKCLTPDSIVRPESETESESKASRITIMPSDFKPSEAIIAWAKEKGFRNPVDLFPAFADNHRAKGSKFKDWDAALRTWVRNDSKFYPVKPSSKDDGWR